MSYGVGNNNNLQYNRYEEHVFKCFFSQSADKDEMLKHYLQLAKEASEEKDVLLYFDETVLGKMNDISGRGYLFIQTYVYSVIRLEIPISRIDFLT